MSETSGKIYLDWNEVTGAVSQLAKTIESYHSSFDRILAVARGGLVPAAMLSHQLGIKEVGSLQLESYAGTARDRLRMHGPIEPKAAGINTFQMWGAFASKWDKAKTLIVDDLHDTGETARWIREMFPEMTIATVYHKQHSATPPPIAFPGLSMPADKWITFPWETS